MLACLPAVEEGSDEAGRWKTSTRRVRKAEFCCRPVTMKERESCGTLGRGDPACERVDGCSKWLFARREHEGSTPARDSE